MNSHKEYAYAKINLFLDVDGMRDDGFHNITTVMHTVSLCDDITVSVSPSRTTTVTMNIEGSRFLPTDSKNLAAKAAYLFLDRIGRCATVNIKLVKRIPIAAGLAGGSTDAAAVLRAMNKLYKRPLTENALLDLSAELGSDIPYCVKGKTALCRGRGEDMTELSSALDLHTVIAVGNEHVSTPSAYRELDRIYSCFDGSVPHGASEKLTSVVDGVLAGSIPPDAYYNVFEDAILPICDGARAIKDKLTALGASAALMSGSGPSVFGVFANEQTARAAEAKMREEGFTAFYARSVG